MCYNTCIRGIRNEAKTDATDEKVYRQGL